VAALLASLVPLLASAQSANPAPGVPPAAASPAAPATALPSSQVAAIGVDAERYIIGPGDSLQVFVWRNPELSATVTVLPDGRISTPLVESVTATGKNPVQLARDIETVLAEYVREPRVSVIVTGAVSTFSQIKVVGQVRRPQSIAFRDGMTILDAVLASGGLAPFAAGNRAKLIRREGDKNVETKVKLQNLVEKGDMSQNMVLRPGDILVIPEARF
jgi:polysaccharide export outer membrane protein